MRSILTVHVTQEGAQSAVKEIKSTHKKTNDVLQASKKGLCWKVLLTRFSFVGVIKKSFQLQSYDSESNKHAFGDRRAPD